MGSKNGLGSEVLTRWRSAGFSPRIDCPCLDCNEPITIRMRDGQVLFANPHTVVGHTNFPFTTAAGTPAR